MGIPSVGFGVQKTPLQRALVECTFCNIVGIIAKYDFPVI